MAYLTKSNYLKIISKIDFKKTGNLTGNIYTKEIYFFSIKEKNRLLALQELFKDPERFVAEFYVPIETTDQLMYVYEGIQPAYHSGPNCSRLNSDYINFEIPKQIRDQGKSAVISFRAWFKQNRYLLTKSDVFAARIYMAYGIEMNSQSINIENSGHEEIENLDLKELETRINGYITKAGQYFNNSSEEKKQVIRKYQKITNLAYSSIELPNNDTRFTDEKIKAFLKQYDVHFKKPVKDLLIEYYRVKYNPDLKFEGYLLEQLGFKKCDTCLKVKHQ